MKDTNSNTNHDGKSRQRKAGERSIWDSKHIYAVVQNKWKLNKQVIPAFSVWGYFPGSKSRCTSRVCTTRLECMFPPHHCSPSCVHGEGSRVCGHWERWGIRQHASFSGQLWSTLQGTSAPQGTNCWGTRAQRGLQTHTQSQVTKLFPRAHQVAINPLFLEKCPLWKLSSSSLWGGSWWEWSRAKKPHISSSHFSESSCHFTEKNLCAISVLNLFLPTGHLLTIT